jgi:A/G-specific adenine glycosylase
MPDAAAPDQEPSQHLLAWYDRHRRALPWRAAPGQPADPYRVWLSEIMLQQTTVAAVIPYFNRFLEQWPTVAGLAAAELDDVLSAWAGLGYYARARNLHTCARTVVERHGGRFPDTEAALIALPGIGKYTAAAVSAIAFDRPAVVVDGNVERVMARVFAVDTPLPAAKPALYKLAAGLSPERRPGDYAQASMDLGATICTPTSPKCPHCPWSDRCAGFARGDAETLPKRAPKKAKPTRRGVAFWIEREDGAVLLRRRPPRGLLGGMVEVPSTEWGDTMPDPAAAREQAPIVADDWISLRGLVRHTFTHFHLELAILTAKTSEAAADEMWCLPDELGETGLPSVMRKVAAHALRAQN